MANKPIEIDHRGFNGMVKEMRKYSNIKTRPLIRGITSDVLHAAAGRTRVGSLKGIKHSMDKHFRQPHEVPGKGFVGITKEKKVWVNLVSWKNKKKWVWVNWTGKLTNLKYAQVPRTVKGHAYGKSVTLKKKYVSEINDVLKAARKYRKDQIAYRKSMLGLSQASWLHLLRVLRLPVRRQRGISKNAFSLRVPTKARAALKAFEQVRGINNFTVVISNAVQATLNNTRGESGSKKLDGMNAFRVAMNGQTNRFKTASRKDFHGYVKQFSKRHGFDVK